MKSAPSLVWFRQDLRLADNPALHVASQRGGPVIPVFVWAPEEEGQWSPGAVSRWWLHHSLGSLSDELRKRKSRLVIRMGPASEALRSPIDATGADAVYWNHRYEPAVVRRDARIASSLTKENVGVHTFHGSLLFDPASVSTREGKPYQVFTPFHRTCSQRDEPGPPLSAPKLCSPERWPDSIPLDDLHLLPEIDWTARMRDAWEPGVAGAEKRVDILLEKVLTNYSEDRDRPDHPGTSRLSPHLHFGEISPRQVWHAISEYGEQSQSAGLSQQADAYRRQLVWREFAHHLLFHFPHTANQPLREKHAAFPWVKDTKVLREWQRGRTGDPIVDAGMRELRTTGWMHNRVCMIVASFLVKDLLISWTEEARWFWDTLVDADLANNTFGWQWAGGCGADAAPYFRIFNPVIQGEKFDPNGDYVRRWVPELVNIPGQWIHQPWETPEAILEQAGVRLGRDYPQPIVDRVFARERALAALQSLTRH